MPLALVRTKPGLLDAIEKKKLARVIQIFVSAALDCPKDEGGGLKTQDIEVRFSEVGTDDYNSAAFSLVVFANEFPSRKANLQERTFRITENLRGSRALPRWVLDTAGSNFVWVLLCPAGFVYL